MFNLYSLYSPKCFITPGKNKECCALIKPSANLNHFIYSYWVSPAGLNPTEDFKASKGVFIVPDGCVDVVFSIDKKKKQFFITLYGPMDKPSTVNLHSDKILNFGITFYPGCLYSFLRCSLSELRNKTYNFDDVINGAWRKLGYEIINSNTPVEMATAANSFFASLLDNYSVTDSLSNMLYRIYSSNGTLSVKELSQREIISERQIDRIFNSWTGINPKRFFRIVRFQSVINAAGSSPNTDWLSIALEHGYYDESHLYNEFKEFCGITPEQYIKGF